MSFSSLVSQSFHQIYRLPEGGFSVTSNPLQVYDSNQNNYPEIYYYTYKHPFIYFTRISEYLPYNRYIFVDTIMNRAFRYIDDLDADNKVDLLAPWGYIYAFEQMFPDSYPTQQVWQSESSYASYGCYHIADLDQDGNKDFLLYNSTFDIEIYENVGDNQYISVWNDNPPFPDNVYNFTSGDFDQDGRLEFVTGDIDVTLSAIVYECIGDNQYEFIFCDTIVPSTNSFDVFFGNDLDQDGKIEFIIGSAPGSGSFWAYQFRVYESSADNEYTVSYTSDIVNRPASLAAGVGSYCGDVDLDGQDEIIWTVQDNWYIYKAFGNNNFQRIFTAYPGYNGRVETRVYVYDINGNGYPEIIETGGNNDPGPNFVSETVIWEIEAVRLLYPNGGEVFRPQDTVEILWQTFDPPGCDSLSLFFSSDSGYNYNTIATGISSSETTYQWIVPDTISDECFLMIWAYGPGVGWDFTDSTFTIEDVGVSGDSRKHLKERFRIYPNPSYGKINLDLPYDVIEINLFDATGRQIQMMEPSPKLKIELTPGIYFLQIKMRNQTRTEKLIILN